MRLPPVAASRPRRAIRVAPGPQADRQHAGVVEPPVEQGPRRRRHLVHAEQLERGHHRDFRGADAPRRAGERAHGGPHGHRGQGGERPHRRADRQEHRPQAGGVDQEVEDADSHRLEAQQIDPQQPDEDADRLVPMGVEALELPLAALGPTGQEADDRILLAVPGPRAPDGQPGEREDQGPQQQEPPGRLMDDEGGRDQHDPGADAHHAVVGHLVVEDDAVEEAEGSPLSAREVAGAHHPAQQPRRRRDQVEGRGGEQHEEPEHRPQPPAEDVFTASW